jgi:glucose-1-phosphate cytidylyltransferase
MVVQSIDPVGQADLWINGGFFVFKQAIFDYMQPGEELVLEPFQRLMAKKELIAYRNPGFWACMDTLKEKIMFDEMYSSGNTPWAVWDLISNCGKTRNRLQFPTLYQGNTVRAS